MSDFQKNNDRILVVDDSKEIRAIVSRFLTEIGYEVLTAGNGLEGMRLFLEGVFNLVITDLNMPEVDGLAFASGVKERSPHVPVVLITGNGFAGFGEKDPFDVVMHKPFALPALQETVQTILRH